MTSTLPFCAEHSSRKLKLRVVRCCYFKITLAKKVMYVKID